MAKRLRVDCPSGIGYSRWTVGVLVSSCLRHAEAAIIGATGSGTKTRASVIERIKVDIPKEARALFKRLSEAEIGKPRGDSIESLVALRKLLAETGTDAVEDLLGRAGVSKTRVSAVAIHAPAIWTDGKASPVGCVELCDASRLAELTGLTVIDAFSARDLAQGGLGGPITALSEWILLRHPEKERLLLDLGRTIRMTYLPADDSPTAPARILSFEVGPGTKILDLLVYKLSDGEQSFDSGGRLAVQGRQIPELIEFWLSNPYFDYPLPRWHPGGVRPERFLTEALQMAIEHEWSVRDMLCSATHFIAKSIAKVLEKRLPEDATAEEVIVTGGGQQNGMLLREIDSQLGGTKILVVNELGIQDDSLGVASIAILANLYLDQVPINSAAITGADVPRVLGRLTPGSSQNWQRLLHQMAGNRPAARSLRSAIH